jgi:hypothetical protein
MIAAALLKVPIRLNPSDGQAFPTGSGYTPLSDSVEPAGTARDSVVKELKLNLMRICGIEPGKDDAARAVAEEQLRQHLTACWDLKEPMFTLLDQGGAHAKAMREDRSFSWRLLAVLEKAPEQASVVNEPRRTAVLLRAVIQRLNELESARKPSK